MASGITALCDMFHVYVIFIQYKYRSDIKCKSYGVLYCALLKE